MFFRHFCVEKVFFEYVPSKDRSFHRYRDLHSLLSVWQSFSLVLDLLDLPQVFTIFGSNDGIFGSYGSYQDFHAEYSGSSPSENIAFHYAKFGGPYKCFKILFKSSIAFSSEPYEVVLQQMVHYFLPKDLNTLNC